MNLWSNIMNEEEKYKQEVENCIKAEMQTFYPEEYKRIYKDENINDSLEELKLDLDFANKKIKELEIEENIFNGISSELYAKQRQVDNLKYSIYEADLVISELLKLNLDINKKLEELKTNLGLFTKI